MRTVCAVPDGVIPIGRLGENEATTVIFNVRCYRETFGNGTFSLLHKRSGDAQPYACVITADDDTVTWVVKDTDVAVQGYGRCELVYTVGDTVAKSVLYSTLVGEALTGGAEPPEPWEDWVQRVLEAGAAAVEAAASAGTSAESAGASAETATEKASDAAQSASAAGAEARAAEEASSVAGAKATDASNSASAAATSETNAATSASAAASSASASSAAATAAQAAQTAAETAKSGAEQAKSDAVTAKTDAQTAAATANTKAGEAAQSATDAGLAKTAAQAAQTAAESAQSAAETAQSAAAESAATASENATAAANSATNASTSATAADTAKTAAQNAATTATQQATAAATSASDAATSAQNASESATGAATSATAAENAKDATIEALEAFHEPTATAQTLQPGTPATASYDGQNFLFGIPNGAPGADGKSAYEAAQDGGYTGTEAQFNADLSGVGALSSDVQEIKSKIPSAASDVNKLVSASEMGDAIEAVEAKQLYATAQQGSFATKSALTSATVFYNADGTVATPTKNDVAYILADESHSGKSAKYVIASVDPIVWGFVITFSDTTFSQAQMDAVNSGITSGKRAGYDSHVADGDIHVTSEQKQTWSGKQDEISDLATIRSGAAAGATAVQPETGKGLFSGNYNDLSNKPTIPTQLSQLSGDATHRVVTDTEKNTWNAKGTYSKPSGGIPKTDLTSAVQSSLDKADSALQEHQSLAAYRTASAQDAIDAGKLGTSDDGSNVTATFAQASTRTNISTGEKLSVLFGKIAKWFTDLKTVAFTGSYNDLSNKPTIPTVPTNVSAFTNDAGYLTQHQSLAAYRTASAQDTIDNNQNTAINGKEAKGKITIGGVEKTANSHTVTIVTDGVTTNFTLVGVS